ncbi:MAG: hypothetical protein R3C05_04365 [Pirellulaceae bacterium]
MAVLDQRWLELGERQYGIRYFRILLRDTDLLRFNPNGTNCHTNADITFRAWDQTGATAGQQGTEVNTSTNGGTTAFSSATEVASLSVTGVNDA